jgi:predicted acylesterase/phospholipase RssA
VSCLPRPRSFLARLLDRKAFFLVCLALFAGPRSSHPAAASFCNTGALKRTLERLVDFDLLNAGAYVGAVNVRAGNFVHFDTITHAIPPEHIRASGPLPRGFPAIEIEAEHYWDGGLAPTLLCNG